MNPVQAVVLGVVEGLTEFLPVSSTGHLTVTEQLLGLKVDDKAITAFTAVIQVGAILATFLYFRADIVRLVRGFVRGVVSAEGRADPDWRFAWCVIVGSIPIGILGLAFKSVIEGPLRSVAVVAVALIAWSAVMWYAERRPAQDRGESALTVRGAGAGGIPVGRDHQRRAAAGHRPGGGDPAVVLPGDPGAHRGRATGTGQVPRRRGGGRPHRDRDRDRVRRGLRNHRLAAALRCPPPDLAVHPVPGRRRRRNPRPAGHRRDQLSARRCARPLPTGWHARRGFVVRFWCGGASVGATGRRSRSASRRLDSRTATCRSWSPPPRVGGPVGRRSSHRGTSALGCWDVVKGVHPVDAGHHCRYGGNRHPGGDLAPVSYTHLTLPTKRIV